MTNPCAIALSLLSIACCLSLLVVTGQVSTDECTNGLEGIAINGRCFYVITDNSSWSGAWAKCAEDGATLAQIHATNEFEAIKVLLEAKGRDPTFPGYIRAWIALQREGPASGCAVTPTTTYWYDGPNEKNTNLPAGNTWVRTHLCDDVNMGDEEYLMGLLMNNDEWLGIGDLPADGGGWLLYPLCQISICTRDYSMNNVDKCMDEVPIESTPMIRFEDCANACSDKPWCRSFDVIPSTSKCNLFTWISSDVVKPNEKTGGCDCVHYDTDQ